MKELKLKFALGEQEEFGSGKTQVLRMTTEDDYSNANISIPIDQLVTVEEVAFVIKSLKELLSWHMNKHFERYLISGNAK